MARVFLATGDTDQARAVIDMLPPEKANDPDIAGVRAALELAASASEAGDHDELGARVAANPDDLQARYDYAEALSARGDLEGASEQLLAIIARNRNWNEEAARKQLLKIFDAAGAASDVAKQGRRKLSAILFS
jgi:putative thioredoxin